jgi:hypothetical protein
MTDKENIEVKIIRLNTGEDVVGNCMFDDNSNSLLIDCPMKVMVSRMSSAGQAMLIMMPWLPLEIIEDNMASINYDDVITIVNPKESFTEYYFETVKKYNDLLEKRANDPLEGEFFDDLEEDEEEIEETTMDELLQSLQEKKKGTLH